MRIKLARTSGFCYGVRRAVNLAFEAALKGGNLYTLGELIHNPQVLEILEMRGVKVAEGVEDIPDGASVIIRSHGVSPQIRRKLAKRNLDIIDATCPKVARVQMLAERAASAGRHLIVFGDRDHSEVKGIAAHAGKKVSIVKDLRGLRRLLAKIPADRGVTMVAQTTQNIETWSRLIETLREVRPDAEVYETICDATYRRQQEVRKLAREVKALVVVGGFASGNTRRLAEIAEEEGARAFHVEIEADLDKHELGKYKTVGVTAGASTPSWMIRRILHALERIRERRGSFVSFLASVWQFIVRSNLLVAYGAAGLLYAATRLQGIEPELTYQWIVAAYIFGTHLLNHFTDRFSTQIKYPARMEFYTRYRRLLLTLGVLGLTSSLIVAYILGPFTFSLIFAMSLLGLVYRVQLFEKRQVWPRRLMDIPGSKDLFLGIAWTVVIAILVVPASDSNFSPATGIAALFVFGIAFTRSLVYSIRDIQGDRMVGRETIPVLIGEKNTRRLGLAVLMIAAAGLIAAYIMGWCSPMALFFLINLVYGLILLILTRSEWLYSDVLFETIVEGNLILTQIIAYVVYLAKLT
ncbi:4-hydroxy-3-methylbut-2-enyl diphosphate reductase [candidate division WOR-3 bacterium]|uniref:4-hydroxy-3-methylbut-2-enyl diphosphate reductase n=1 Tax=candidate division WOR-3 bacterium TaxID=2052148 RepID=A0A9D5K9S5_UNCW3|nr:4-hydroxy-3-methylbut-2-enyl diphosphate reductase [candidate division WOR-3 bacterium]MBD3364195.1 4-hydroxy-3-methylbut-2-enyl diphosphate reductase [candidate division WOR-3 bacterium]